MKALSTIAMLLFCGVATLALADTSHDRPHYRCSSVVPEGPGTFKGTYTSQFENSSLKMKSPQCNAWVQGRLEAVFDGKPRPKGGKFHGEVVFEGRMSANGRFGHRGAWERRLTVTRVISARATALPSNKTLKPTSP